MTTNLTSDNKDWGNFRQAFLEGKISIPDDYYVVKPPMSKKLGGVSSPSRFRIIDDPVKPKKTTQQLYDELMDIL